jgi:hypothetical protein
MSKLLKLISLSCITIPVLPEHPVVMNRWGRTLNGTLLGPKEEGDDIILTCRVVGGEYNLRPKNLREQTLIGIPLQLDILLDTPIVSFLKFQT